MNTGAFASTAGAAGFGGRGVDAAAGTWAASDSTGFDVSPVDAVDEAAIGVTATCAGAGFSCGGGAATSGSAADAVPAGAECIDAMCGVESAVGTVTRGVATGVGVSVDMCGCRTVESAFASLATCVAGAADSRVTSLGDDRLASADDETRYSSAGAFSAITGLDSTAIVEVFVGPAALS